MTRVQNQKTKNKKIYIQEVFYERQHLIALKPTINMHIYCGKPTHIHTFKIYLRIMQKWEL